MVFLANILTQNKIEVPEFINVVNTKDGLIDDLPTLVIGWELAKSIYVNTNTIDWKINDNIYWTFGKREKRDRNEHDINKFIELVISNYVKKIKYQFVNIFLLSESEKRSFVNEIKNSKHGVFFIFDDVIYLNLNKNEIIGISLKDIEYSGCNRKKILAIIYKNQNIKQITSDIIPIYLRKQFISMVYVIPTLFF